MIRLRCLVSSLLLAVPLVSGAEPVAVQHDGAASPLLSSRPALVPERAGSGGGQGVIHKVLIPFTGRQLADRDYQQALRFLGAGNVAQAQTKLSDALASEPLHVPARQLLATLYAHNQRTAEALQLLQDGVRRLPQEPVLNMMLARLYGEQGQAATAIAILQKLAVQDGLRNRYDAMLAALYQRAGRYDDAIALYRDLLQRNPHQALWWMGLAMALEASQRPANALTAYQQARSAGPGRHALMSFIEARIAALSHPQAADKQAQG